MTTFPKLQQKISREREKKQAFCGISLLQNITVHIPPRFVVLQFKVQLSNSPRALSYKNFEKYIDFNLLHVLDVH